MIFYPLAALLFAALESFALWKKIRPLEYVAKPAVMLVLFAWLTRSAGLSGAALWFGLGLLCSLAGDILLMISLERLFLAGLVAFLLAHVFYVIGFNVPLSQQASAWSFVLAMLIGVSGARVMRPILAALAGRGQARMKLPVLVYSLVISVMLLSAMLKIFDPAWKLGAAALVSLGAFLFYLSDILLAWNKFVAPIQHGRIYNICAYHLGQVAIIAGVIMQFT